MACMCGDTQCWSCGPAQGNHRCGSCGEWADDHDEHIYNHKHSDACYGPDFPKQPVCGQDECSHDDARCGEEAREAAEAEYEWEVEMERHEAAIAELLDPGFMESPEEP